MLSLLSSTFFPNEVFGRFMLVHQFCSSRSPLRRWEFRSLLLGGRDASPRPYCRSLQLPCLYSTLAPHLDGGKIEGKLTDCAPPIKHDNTMLLPLNPTLEIMTLAYMINQELN